MRRVMQPCRAQADDKRDAAGPRVEKNALGLGDALGPIGLTLGKSLMEDDRQAGAQLMQRAADAAGVSLGPIGLTIGGELRPGGGGGGGGDAFDPDAPPPESIACMTTAEWRQRFEPEGRVDLWVEEEFNSGSRLVGGRAAHYGGVAGGGSGEGATRSDAPRHKVKIFNRHFNQELEVEVPEDRYILWEAEDQGLELPYACRMGCCTACAVRVTSGEMYQPQSLGLSAGLKAQGYALMCVGFPLSDLVLETVPEDEAYELQFGRAFEEQATDPNARTILRDDFAIELALLDE